MEDILIYHGDVLRTRGKHILIYEGAWASFDLRGSRIQAISLLQATLRRNRASFNPRLMRLRLARMRDKAEESDDEEEDNH